MDRGEVIFSEKRHRKVRITHQAVCCSAGDEILHGDVFKIATASVTLYHHGLISTIGVNILGTSNSTQERQRGSCLLLKVKKQSEM